MAADLLELKQLKRTFTPSSLSAQFTVNSTLIVSTRNRQFDTECLSYVPICQR